MSSDSKLLGDNFVIYRLSMYFLFTVSMVADAQYHTRDQILFALKLTRKGAVTSNAKSLIPIWCFEVQPLILSSKYSQFQPKSNGGTMALLLEVEKRGMK